MSPLPPPLHLLQFGTTKRNQENKRIPENQQTQKNKEKKRKTKEKESGSSAEQTKHKHLHTRSVWYCKRAASTTQVTYKERID
jgi:hypothetical protein